MIAAAKGPVDFGELAGADHSGLPAPGFFTARDGARLALRRYPAASDTALVALHGSSGEGIDYIGQLEDDLDDLIAVIREERPQARIVLLGHSSGGGLVVRFAGGRRRTSIAGYVLLAPFLGPDAPPTRPASGGRAQPDGLAINDLLAGAKRGDVTGQDRIVLRFNKAPSHRTGREVLAYSFRMMVAYHPGPDLAGDLAAIRQPLLVLAGTRDQSFIPELYEPTIAPHAGGTFRLLPGLTHFGVVVDARAVTEIAAWLSTSLPTHTSKEPS